MCPDASFYIASAKLNIFSLMKRIYEYFFCINVNNEKSKATYNGLWIFH